MFWDRLFRREAPDANTPLLNVHQVVERGLTSHEAARDALRQLTREEDRVKRRIKAIARSHRAMTPGKVRQAVRAGASSGTPGLIDSFQRQLADDAANTARQDAQIEMLEEHRKSLRPARNRLRSYLTNR